MTITERQQGDVNILTPEGRMLHADGDEPFRNAVRPLLEGGRVRLVVDMEGVPFIDSSGIGEIVRACVTARKKGGDVKLAQLRHRVHEALEITKLLTVIDAFETVEEAVQHFPKEPLPAETGATIPFKR